MMEGIPRRLFSLIVGFGSCIRAKPLKRLAESLSIVSLSFPWTLHGVNCDCCWHYGLSCFRCTRSAPLGSIFPLPRLLFQPTANFCCSLHDHPYVCNSWDDATTTVSVVRKSIFSTPCSGVPRTYRRLCRSSHLATMIHPNSPLAHP